MPFPKQWSRTGQRTKRYAKNKRCTWASQLFETSQSRWQSSGYAVRARLLRLWSQIAKLHTDNTACVVFSNPKTHAQNSPHIQNLRYLVNINVACNLVRNCLQDWHGDNNVWHTQTKCIFFNKLLQRIQWLSHRDFNMPETSASLHLLFPWFARRFSPSHNPQLGTSGFQHNCEPKKIGTWKPRIRNLQTWKPAILLASSILHLRETYQNIMHTQNQETKTKT